MGEVYRARDARLGRDVAIKVLRGFIATGPDQLARFDQEARATAALNHPNILAVYDTGEHDGAPFIVTELLDGRSLRDIVAAGPLPVDIAIDYATQIAQGLAAAHDKGIVHRDLKPENVFITADGRPKILDFGLAKLAAPAAADATGLSLTPTITSPALLTEVGMLLGTAAYMSPEQARGQAVDKRADIWAFGVVLYEMVTGHTPFVGNTQQGDFLAVTLSPDAARAAVTQTGSGNRDIWIYDLSRNAATRLTFDSAADDSPVWSPDGRHIAFRSLRGAQSQVQGDGAELPQVQADAGIYVKRVDGTGDEQLLIRVAGLVGPTGWSSDGRVLFYTVAVPGKWRAVMAVDVTTKQTSRLLEASFDQQLAAPSPDGQWLGYLSDETGRPELYVRHLDLTGDRPTVSGKWMISTEGAQAFWWGTGGRTLYFVPRAAAASYSVPRSVVRRGHADDSVRADNLYQSIPGVRMSILAVDVMSKGDEFIAGPPRPSLALPPGAATVYTSAVSADGSTALLVIPAAQSSDTSGFSVMVNWLQTLAR